MKKIKSRPKYIERVTRNTHFSSVLATSKIEEQLEYLKTGWIKKGGKHDR